MDVGPPYRKPPVPRGAGRTWRKVVDRLHAAAPGYLLECRPDVLGLTRLSMILAPTDPTMFAAVSRAGDLWMMRCGPVAPGEMFDTAVNNFKPLDGLESTSDRAVAAWIGQAMYDAQLVALLRHSEEDVAGLILETNDRLIRTGLATKRDSYDEIRAAWLFNIVDQDDHEDLTYDTETGDVEDWDPEPPF